MSKASSLEELITTNTGNSSPFSHRIRDVFPPGFDKVSTAVSGRGHYTLSPGQLNQTLTSCYGPEKHIESIVVKAAWYGKQSRLAKQEFILVQVNDLAIHSLTNYIVIHRSTSTPSSVFSGLIPHSRLRFQGEMARDSFKIAYNGDKDQLLRECSLIPSKYLAKLEFSSDHPLLLYQLSTLAHVISERHPQYRIADINGSGFAALVWNCIHKICPQSIYTSLDQGTQKRGKHSWVHSTPGPAEVTEMCQSFHKEISAVEVELSNQRTVSSSQFALRFMSF
jgi:hypothetical protein